MLQQSEVTKVEAGWSHSAWGPQVLAGLSHHGDASFEVLTIRSGPGPSSSSTTWGHPVVIRGPVASCLLPEWLVLVKYM